MKRRSPASARKTSTRRSASTGFRPSCARCAARSRRPQAHALPRLDRSRRPARRSPHAQHRDRRQRRRPDDGGGGAQAGLEYIAITDHSQSLAMANGLDETARPRARGAHPRDRPRRDRRPAARRDRVRHQVRRLARSGRRLPRRARHRRSPPVHSAFSQDRQQMTDRLLRAIENPHVDIVGHPTGRRILQRAPYAVRRRNGRRRRRPPRRGVRDQLPGRPAGPQRRPRQARARSRRAPGASRPTRMRSTAFGCLRWGVLMARRAWLQPSDVLNTRAVRRLPRVAAPQSVARGR